MSKFKKIDKFFTLGDSSLNSYSYRLLTSGFVADQFKKNAVGYYMHGQTKEFPRDLGVLVKWEDLQVEGDAIIAKPCINLLHPRGQRTADEIESGFLNAASFGSMKVLEISDDPKDYLPGQTGITAKKWFPGECSLVDRGGNYNATATDLIDENGQALDLSKFVTPKNSTMLKIELTPAQLAAIPNLKSEATQADVDTALADLIEKAGKVETLTNDLAVANTAKTNAETELANLKASTVEKQVADLIDAGVDAKKFTVAGGNVLKAKYSTDPTGLKSLMDTMQPITGIVARLDGAAKNVADLGAKSFDELDKAGQLEALKAADPSSFFEKFEGKFNKKHAEDPTK